MMVKIAGHPRPGKTQDTGAGILASWFFEQSKLRRWLNGVEQAWVLAQNCFHLIFFQCVSFALVSSWQ
jgi:hypothetical protein